MNIEAKKRNYEEIQGKRRWASLHLNKNELIQLLDNDDKRVIMEGLRSKKIDELPEPELLYIMFNTQHLKDKIYEAVEKKVSAERAKMDETYYSLLKQGFKHPVASMKAYGGII